MKQVMIDLSSFAASDMEEVAYDFSADNKDEAPVLRRRIVAVSEGTHNNIKFVGTELQKMVKGCVDLKAQKQTKYLTAPITVGHTDNPLLKVGTTYDLKYDPTTNAAIADVLFWQETGVQKDLARLIKQDPENTFFSVRVVGKMDDDNVMHDLKLIHIANVIQPADSNARMLAELSDATETQDLAKKEETPESEKTEEEGVPEEDPDDEEGTDIEEDEEEDEEEEIDQSLYVLPEKIKYMSNEDVTVDRIIELQQLNNTLVADLEDAHRALIEAEAELTAKDEEIEFAMQKGALLAELRMMDLAIDEDFVASLSAEQLEKYVAQVKSFAACKPEEEEPEEEAPKKKAKKAKEPEPEEDEEEEEAEMAQAYSSRGRSYAGGLVVNLSAQEEATRVFGDVNKQRW